ncbi:HRDC domain-containing protein, partial [uncultured Alistipes sp.]|uniref:HRDC domain-containing protein n=1 Tax=uncultured Alistipes sp. TaxID=538949 RepID=UPI0032B11167
RVLADANGNLLTDMELLAKLRTLRQTLAQEERLPAYCVFTNDILSRLATEKPMTREELVEIKGIGEQRYKRFGERFIAEIRRHVES